MSLIERMNPETDAAPASASAEFIDFANPAFDAEQATDIGALIIAEEIDAEKREEERRAAVDAIFPPTVIAEMTKGLIDRYSIDDKIGDRRWAVMALDGDDPLADVARYVECEKFSKLFDLTPEDMRTQYGKYDSSSIFILVVDCKEDEPIPASMIRITRNADEGIKTFNTMTSQTEKLNPWYDKLSEFAGAPLETLTPEEVQSLVIELMGGIDLDSTWGVESMAALDGYAGSHGALDQATFPLYAATLQLSDILGQKTWISGQDLKPYQQMQDMFAQPWETIGDMPAREFEGTPVLPTIIPDLALAEERLTNFSPETAEMMIKLGGLAATYAMPDELQGLSELSGLNNLHLIDQYPQAA